MRRASTALSASPSLAHVIATIGKSHPHVSSQFQLSHIQSSVFVITLSLTSGVCGSTPSAPSSAGWSLVNRRSVYVAVAVSAAR